MPSRVVPPLDPGASQAANEALYQKYESEPRPNALFDKTGKRKALSATAPDQAALRAEWVQAYGCAGGKVETPKPAGSKPVGSPVQSCPVQKKKTASLTVLVRYDPKDAPVDGALVTITGPVTETATTGASGSVNFKDLPPGSYSITTKYTKTHPLVETAKVQKGATTWSVAADRALLHPSGVNKCNGFVYDMAKASGYSLPVFSRFSLSKMRPVPYLPLAKEYADPGMAIGSTTVVSDPLPGDLIAEAHQYTNASGHVGIIGYPLDGTGAQALAEGDNATATVPMKRTTISAGDDEVLYNGWGWRAEQAGGKFIYRRF